MAGRSVRRSLSMTPEMRDRLVQLVSKQPRDVTEADLIREAIRLYLDNQEDIIGSRRHFQKSLQARLDRLEGVLTSFGRNGQRVRRRMTRRIRTKIRLY